VLWSHNPNKWVLNRRLNCPRLLDCLSSVGRVPHSWASDSKTPVAVGGPCTIPKYNIHSSLSNTHTHHSEDLTYVDFHQVSHNLNSAVSADYVSTNNTWIITVNSHQSVTHDSAVCQHHSITHYGLLGL